MSDPKEELPPASSLPYPYDPSLIAHRNQQYRLEDVTDARHRQLMRVLQDIKDLLRSTVDRLQIIETVVRRK